MNDHVKELLHQMLETELGGVQVYTTALECVVNDDLEEEWTEYLEQTERHVEVMRELFGKLGLDPEAQTPGRQVVQHIGESLVQAMQMALASGGEPEAAELVACECVVLAETKDHLNWELLSKVRQESQGRREDSHDGGVRGSRRPGRRAHLSQQGLVPRVVDSVAGHACGSAAA